MKENSAEKFSLWLDWFISDNKLNVDEVLFEGDVEGEPVSVNMRTFFGKALSMPGWQDEIRRIGLKAQYTGGDIIENLKVMCGEKARKGFFS